MSLLPGVDLMAHVGGFASGFVLGKIMKDRPPMSLEEQKRASIYGWATAGVILASVAVMLVDLFKSLQS